MSTPSFIVNGQILPFKYYPSEWVGALFLVLYCLTTIVHVAQSYRYRLWYLAPTMGLCGISEIIGWSGRLWGAINPFVKTAFLMQMVTTIVGPSFMTAAIFAMLPTVIKRLGSQYSRLTPKYYFLIFIPFDGLALLIQAVGGAKAAVSFDNIPEANIGGRIMLAGVLVQLLALISFAICMLELLIRFHYDLPIRRPSASRPPASQSADSVLSNLKESSANDSISRWNAIDTRVILLLFSTGITLSLLIIRSIYRTIELGDGWTGTIISEEWPFAVFDGFSVLTSMIIMNVFHVGWLLHHDTNRDTFV